MRATSLVAPATPVARGSPSAYALVSGCCCCSGVLYPLENGESATAWPFCYGRLTALTLNVLEDGLGWAYRKMWTKQKLPASASMPTYTSKHTRQLVPQLASMRLLSLYAPLIKHSHIRFGETNLSTYSSQRRLQRPP